MAVHIDVLPHSARRRMPVAERKPLPRNWLDVRCESGDAVKFIKYVCGFHGDFDPKL